MSIWDNFAKIAGYGQVANTPAYALAAPQFVQGVHDALFNSGIAPSNDQLSLLNGGGVEDNPYSVVAQLKKQNASQNHATINAANAANLEESGAAAGALNANSEAYKQNYANEAARVGSQVSGLLGNFTNTVGNIFQNLEQNPVAAPAVAAPAPVPGVTNTPVTSSAALSQPGADISGAKAAAAARSVATRLKANSLTGITGGLGLGHIS